MKFFALLALAPLALAFPGKRQDAGTPACVLECFNKAGEGPCGMTDIQCQCTNMDSQKISTQCLVDTCSPAEFSGAVAFAADLCRGQGYPIQTEGLPEGVTAPAGYLESIGLAPPAETDAASASESPAANPSATTPAPAPSASASASGASSAPAASGTPKPSTTSTGTGTAPASSTAAASATTTNGAMATGVVNGFVAVAGLGAALLAF